MVNEEIARIFDRMAKVLAFKGGNRFRIMAYERGAASLRELNLDLREVPPGSFDEIPAIGKDLSGMIAEYLATGRIQKYETERAGLPEDLIDLMSVPGLGPKTLALLHEHCGVAGLADLQRTLADPATTQLPGFGERRVAALRKSLDVWSGGHGRMPLGFALPAAEELLRRIRALPHVDRGDLAGSLRRAKETIGDVDILIASAAGEEALSRIANLPGVKRVTALGETRLSMILEGDLQVDVRAVPAASYGAALQYFTGSKDHNVHLRTLARDRGLKINEYGVFRGDRKIGGEREEDVYEALGLAWTPPPEIREDHGEIELAADRGRMPRLVDGRDLRGDLHIHSTYSDGRSTIAEIHARAAELGYAYVAVSDHSPSARIARGLDIERLHAKLAELRHRRSTRGPLLLAGAEVDILPDGKLDYPDEILAQLDVVIIGIHSAFQQPRYKTTGRILDALDHPGVHVLAHPTARLIGSRGPLDYDFERIARRAAERHVALEINGSPQRLDLNDTLIRIALDAGCLLCAGSDAHSTAHMSDVRYAVLQARRGWVPSSRILNTWPAPKLIRWLHGKRTSGERLAG
jgi:DNA polymerase (family 10)